MNNWQGQLASTAACHLIFGLPPSGQLFPLLCPSVFLNQSLRYLCVTVWHADADTKIQSLLLLWCPHVLFRFWSVGKIDYPLWNILDFASNNWQNSCFLHQHLYYQCSFVVFCSHLYLLLTTPVFITTASDSISCVICTIIPYSEYSFVHLLIICCNLSRAQAVKVSGVKHEQSEREFLC